MTSLLRHSAIYLLARGLPGIVNFLAIAIYTRLLSPDEYGRYALVVAGVGLANTVLFQWLCLSVLRFLPTYQTPAQLLSSVKGVYYAIVGATGLIAAGAAVLGVPAEWKRLVLVALPLLWFQAWFDLNLEITRTRLHPVRYGLGAGTRALTMVATGTLLAHWYPVAYAPLTGLIIGAVAGGMLLARKQWWGFWANLDKKVIQQILRYGLPLTGTFALSFVVSYSDRFLLAHYLGEQAAGLYAAGYDMVSQTLIVAMMVVNMAAYPLAVSALEQQGLEAAQTQLLHNMWLLLTTSTPLAVVMVVFSSEISSLILGGQFHEAAGAIVPWVSIAVLLSGVRAYYFDLAFQLGKHTLGQLWVVGTAAVTNIALNIEWIPRWGLVGAAWATFAAYAAALVTSAILGTKVFPIPISWKAITQVAIATLAMLGVWCIIPRASGTWAILLQAGVMLLVYCCCTLVLLRFFRQRQIRGGQRSRSTGVET